MQTAIATLAAYVLVAMNAWVPKYGPGQERMRSIAHDIAEVSVEARAPLFDEGDEDRSRTALLLASISRHESNYAAWVDSGECNDETWRSGPRGADLAKRVPNMCDGGHAYGVAQVHPFPGGPTAEQMRADRKVALRAALVLLRGSFARARESGGELLCGYTGERGSCPKAARRLRDAEVWRLGHPFDPTADLPRE
jgi:hypothetical protein